MLKGIGIMEKNTTCTRSESKIISEYKRLGSIKKTSSETGYSWNRVVKALSSHGYILSETHAEILDKYEKGTSVNKIASELNINAKTVQAYLPRVRPVYNEGQSINALRIKKCRKHKLESLK